MCLTCKRVSLTLNDKTNTPYRPGSMEMFPKQYLESFGTSNLNPSFQSCNTENQIDKEGTAGQHWLHNSPQKISKTSWPGLAQPVLTHKTSLGKGYRVEKGDGSRFRDPDGNLVIATVLITRQATAAFLSCGLATVKRAISHTDKRKFGIYKDTNQTR